MGLEGRFTCFGGRLYCSRDRKLSPPRKKLQRVVHGAEIVTAIPGFTAAGSPHISFSACSIGIADCIDGRSWPLLGKCWPSFCVRKEEIPEDGQLFLIVGHLSNEDDDLRRE